MAVFLIEYRKDGYKLSDGLRPDPKYGKRRFTVNSEDIGTDDIAQVFIASRAKENTPDRYELFSVENINTGERILNK